MKKLFLTMSMLFVMLMALVSVAVADEAKPADTGADDFKKLFGLSVYFQGGYTENFINPDPHTNDLRVFDHKSDSTTLDLVQLLFNKDAQTGGFGYRLKLSVGETAKWIHSWGLGIKDGQNPQDTSAFDLTEAYIDYVAPVGKGLKFRVGKFATYNGAEVIEARDNPNYSRSLLFNYAIPFTHTGLMAGYTFSDALTANFYLMQGWDTTEDNNKGKTVGASIAYTPMEQLAMTFNFTYGPEQAHDSTDNRFLFDWIGTIKPTKKLTFILNTDYATEQNAAPDGGTAKWYGIAGIVKYDFSDLFSASARAEYFNDKDGTRTTVNGVSGIPQILKEVTLTPEFRVAKNVIIRPEYRHDWSNREAFDSGSRKGQDTLALGMMYTW